MTSAVICEKCGSDYSPSSAGGFCPQCLLRAGLDDLANLPDVDEPITGSLHARVFGDYELLEEIARGGMGVVYRARQRSLGRVVAIKMLLAGEFANPEAVRRFRQEAAATARLQHPNIVAIHEVGACEGLPFLCMDFVDGPNLAHVIREHPLPVRQAAAYLKSIADAVHYAHAQGLLHRDLKPSNVLVDPFGEPRVTDFGLAKDFTGEATGTTAGALAGTLGYMPPEQADPRQGAMSPASDVYSLGAVLYHLVTGRPPFASGSIHETLHQLLNSEPISPRLLNEGVPRDLETICLKCLAKEPARRYASAQELANELERFLNGVPIRARPISPFERLWFWCRRQPALAALSGAVLALLLTLAIGASVAALRIDTARDAETRHRQRAEQTVAQFELQRADDLLRESKTSAGLAQLAHVLRLDPSNRVAAARIYSVLTRRSFGLPIAEPLSHGARVRMVQFSPDGQRIVTASADGTARVWDAATSRPLTEPLRHGGDVYFAKFDPSGAYIITASTEQTVCFWNAETGASMAAPIRHAAPLEIVEISRNGRVLVTAGGGFAQVWDLATRARLGGPLQHAKRDGRIACLDVSGDGSHVATGGFDNVTRVWDVATGETTHRFQLYGRPRWVEFSADGTRLVTAGDDSRAQVWDLPSGQRVCEMTHRAVLEHAAFSPDGARLATTSRDATARLWDANTGEPLSAPLPHRSVVKDAVFSADGARLLTTCWDNTAWVWDARTGELLVQPLKHENRINAAAFSPDGQRVVTASEDRTAQVWDIRQGKETMARFHLEEGGGMNFDAQGARVLTFGARGIARIWDAATGAPLSPSMAHRGSVISAQFSPDGARVVTTSFDKTAVIWEAATGRPLMTLPAQDFVMEYAEFSPDSRRLVTAARDATARVWDAATGQPLTPPLRHANRIWLATFSRDGRRIATASDDGTARVWDAKTGALLGAPLQHQASVYSAMFSPDGERVVTASFDMTARIWDVRTGQPLTPPLKHYSVLRYAEFSSDGTRVITAAGDNTARIWDAHTGQPMGAPMQHQSEVWKALFSPNGAMAATVSQEGIARLWDAQTGQPLSEPIRHTDAFGRISFSPNGRQLALGRVSLDTFILELPDYGATPPAWFAELAEAVASQRVSETGNLDFVSPRVLLKLEKTLAKSNGADNWTRFGRWFFADRAARAISPYATLTTSNLVTRLVAENTMDALREALQLAPDHGEARFRAARHAFTTEAAPPALHDPEKEAFRRWARALPETGWLEAERWEDTDFPRAFAAIERAATRPPPANPNFAFLQARLYSQTNRPTEALAAFTRAAELTRGKTNAALLHTTARIGRRTTLLQLNRRAEALADEERPLPIPPRKENADPRLIDLGNFYNAGLPEPWHSWGRPNNTLGLFLPGVRTLGGVPFDARGIIQLAGVHLDKSQPGYPRSVRAIPIGQTCARLQFLHASGWGGFEPIGTEVGQYRLQYASGREEIIPIIVGEDVFEWFEIPGIENGMPRGRSVWRGKTPEGGNIRLFKLAWENPHPNDPIQALDFISHRTAVAPFLLAVTTEE